MVLLKFKAMKKLIITSILALLTAGWGALRAQDQPEEYLGLPGDNLNLYAVMNLFQESETLEGFERNLNDEYSRINNLDLNGDNLVDYITVSDYVDGDVHTIVLRAILSRKESQDVAVFTVEKLRNGEVRIQLIGDEALYGRNYIIEPIYAETPNPGYRRSSVNRNNVNVVTTTYYDIAVWPVVRFIYQPRYVVWRSSWYWGYYPAYWCSWRPFYWHYYYGYHYNWYPHYYSLYHYSNHYYYVNYHNHYYRQVRHYSPLVSSRIEKGYYKTTYSRPEQRKEGEALYKSVNSTSGTRRQMSTATGSQERRTTAQPVQNKGTAATGTATTGRTTRTAATSSGTTGRSTDASARRSVTGSSSATKSSVTTGRETSAKTQRTAAGSSATRSTATTRSSSSTVSKNTGSKPANTVQRTRSASSTGTSTNVRRTSGSSGSSATVKRTASRSSSQVKKSAPAVNKSSEAKKPATVSTRRR